MNVGSGEEADNVGHDFGRSTAVKASVLSKYEAVGEKQDFQNQTTVANRNLSLILYLRIKRSFCYVLFKGNK